MKARITHRIIHVVALLGCVSTFATDQPVRVKTSIADNGSLERIRDAFEEYPDSMANGISKHLVRSHTTAIIVRPISSSYEICNRAFDQIWDVGRRLEVRLIRFPMLRRAKIPRLSPNPKGMNLIEWEKRLDHLTGGRPTFARIDFLIDGEAFYSSLEQAITEANYSIDLQTYLFDNDDVARSIADHLRARSKDIEVRVMYDGLGTYLSHEATAESLPPDYSPIEDMPRYLCRKSAIQLRVLPNTWLSGNHVKCMIFDDRLAFVGGMNLGREYRYEWHDMMIRLEGGAVEHLAEEFENTWKLHGRAGDFAAFLPMSSNPKSHWVPDEVPIRFLRTLPAQAQIYRAQLKAIRRARAYIFIENAYFADDRILYELCRARRRGVDVRVIMPSVVNHKVMEYSNKTAINTLLENGVRVFMYPGMSHVKAAVYDGWACVGTANFDKLSLQINRELNLATSHSETVKRLLDVLFIPDFKQSKEITKPVSIDLVDRLSELVADET